MLIVALGLALCFIPKGELHLLLCNRHTPARDIFYRYYTHIAEWAPYVICVLILLLSRAGNAAMAATCIACSELTTQIVKHIVQAPRPITWFAVNMPDIQLPLAEGVRVNQWLSFPSGHTTSFFALFFVLSICLTTSISNRSRKKGNEPVNRIETGSIIVIGLLQILLFLLAALGGYSRIYLSQHFAADVLGGIVIGITISTLCYAIFSRYEDQKWYNFRMLGYFFQKK
jgi:membrane-associated phospholipid phosphatase